VIDFENNRQRNSDGQDGLEDPLEVHFHLNGEDLKSLDDVLWKLTKSYFQNCLLVKII
jgi:hypothetical protein